MKIAQNFEGQLQGKTVALWGLAFKPNTDDLREAPSRVLRESLWARVTRVRACGPEAMLEARRLHGRRDAQELGVSMEAALEGADLLAVVTEWQVFRAPHFELIKRKITVPVIFNGRNLYEPSGMRQRDLRYFSIGRGA